MASDVDGSSYDIGTTSIRLIRVGGIVQANFSSAAEAAFLYRELAARYKQAEDKLRGGSK